VFTFPAPLECRASCPSTRTRRVFFSEGRTIAAISAGTKNRIFISEVFRFEELAFELVAPEFYRVFFRHMEVGELNVEELRLGLHEDTSLD
jgi:hypothetical protein